MEQRNTGLKVAAVVGVLLFALLLGISGAVLGAQAQLVLVIILIPAAVLVFNQPLGLILFIMLVPYNGSQLIPRPAQNMVFFGIVALFFARLALRAAGGKPLNLPLPREVLWYILLVTGAVVLGCLHLKEITPYFILRSGMESYGFKEYVVGVYARQMTLVVMAGIITWLLVQNVKRAGWIIGTALASGVLFVIMMFVVLAAGGFAFDELRNSRTVFMALGRQSNNAGGLLFILFACSLFMWEMSRSGRLKFALLISTLLLMVGVLLTASRGAILAMLVVLVLYVLEFRRLRAAFAMLTIAAVGFALAPESVHERMLQGLDSRSVVMAAQGPGDEVTSGRLEIWRRLAPEIFKSPVIGRGLFSTQWSDYARTGGYWATHPHSLYLGIAMDTGLVGLAIMFLFYRYLWRTFRGLARDTRVPPHIQGYFLGASAAVVAYLVFGVPNGYWHPSPDQTYLWVAIGLAIGYRAALGPTPVTSPVPSARVRPSRVPVYQRS